MKVILNKHRYILFYLLLLSTAVSTFSMEPPYKKQKKGIDPIYTKLFDAILDNDFEKMQTLSNRQKIDANFFISYQKTTKLFMLEMCIPNPNNKDKDMHVKTNFYENEKCLLLRVKFLLVNNIKIYLAELEEEKEEEPQSSSDSDEEHPLSWATLAPTLAKYLLIEPSDPNAYKKNPDQYLTDHPNDFNAVSRYLPEFEHEIQFLQSIKLNKIEIEHGSRLNYLKNREIGFTPVPFKNPVKTEDNPLSQK